MHLQNAQCDTLFLWDNSSPLQGPRLINHLPRVMPQISLKFFTVRFRQTADFSVESSNRRSAKAVPVVLLF
jgi:hypothetical protein